MFRRSLHVPCYAKHDELIAAEGEPDAYVPMASLFGIVGLPDGRPYLIPGHSVASLGRKVVGLAWRGGTSKTNKRERSLALEELRPIMQAAPPWVEFISVQYDTGKVIEEAEALGLPHNVEGRDLDSQADAVFECDLVISVCQSAVHLAGAMGVPCWVLTPKKCAWRYAGKSDRVPWYNSVRLFRQGDDEKWGPVVERMAAELPGLFA
jgi:hypothetical protein